MATTSTTTTGMALDRFPPFHPPSPSPNPGVTTTDINTNNHHKNPTPPTPPSLRLTLIPDQTCPSLVDSPATPFIYRSIQPVLLSAGHALPNLIPLLFDMHIDGVLQKIRTTFGLPREARVLLYVGGSKVGPGTLCNESWIT
ncbi:hypothetical protein DFH27DRAFT_527171 [Peziza echinospora]|nr:hypothetical protein DFH27DRAFT_527171 [Peziza echinospora]